MINWRRANQVQGRRRGLGEGKQKFPFKVFASSAKMASIFGPVISQRLRSPIKSIEWHIPWLMCCYCSATAAAISRNLSTLNCANVPSNPPGFDLLQTKQEFRKKRIEK